MPAIPAREAMSAVCLMDAFCDYETAALSHRAACGLTEWTDTPPPGGCPDTAIGETLMALRTSRGSFVARHEILALAPLTDRAWDACDPETECGLLAFDFEFCPAAIRLHFVDGLCGDALVAALADWLRAERAAVLARLNN